MAISSQAIKELMEGSETRMYGPNVTYYSHLPGEKYGIMGYVIPRVRGSQMKTCKMCKEEKPFTAYYKNKQLADGVENQCKECRKAKMRDNHKNPEVRAAKIAYRNKRMEDPEYAAQEIARIEAWRQKRMEDPAYRQKCVDRARRWQKANPGKALAIQRKVNIQREIRQKEATVEWADTQYVHDIYANAREFNDIAADLGMTQSTWQMQVDHEIPLQGDTVSGLHNEYNLQVINAKANRQKGNAFTG